MFCQITQNWHSWPCTDRAAVVELITATTTNTALTIAGALDSRTHGKGIKVNDVERKRLAICGNSFHPD